MLQISNINKYYRTEGIFGGKKKHILKDVSLSVNDGECMGIIGESGSGKSTLGRMILGIEKPDSGTVLLNGKTTAERKNRVGAISCVFQDYSSSMNPFYTVEQIIAEPLRLFKRDQEETRKTVTTLLEYAGLDDSYRKRFPHELSGGEAQRVCIMRAIAAEPVYILLDEAISSLDASISYQILELLKRLKEEKQIGYIFITHDILAAMYLCDRVVFFQDGRVLEIKQSDDIKSVENEYCKKLLSAVVTL